MNLKKKIFYQYIKIILGLAIIVFIIKQIYENINKVDFDSLYLDYFYFVFSFVILIFVLFIQLVIWFLITYFEKINISFLKTCKIRSCSEIGKYVPGRVALYGILFSAYKNQNVSVKKIASCSIFESLFSLISSLIVFLIATILSFYKIERGLKLISFILLPILFVFIYPRFLEKLLNPILKFFKKDELKIEISYPKVIIILIFNIFNWFIFGLFFFFLINSFYHLSFDKYIYITGTFSISSFLGFLAIFVPAGLGVRESSLIILLGKLIAEPYSSIASILSRLFIIIGDVFLFMIFFLNDKFCVSRK